MSAKISRWGNSLAVRIPSNVAEKACFSEGESVEISVTRQGRVVIEASKKEIDFGALYEMIQPENQYESVSTGATLKNENVTW